MMNRHSKITRSHLAKEQAQQRLLCPIAAAMVRCVRDNGRWLSVAKYLHQFSPTLYKLLVQKCLNIAKDKFADFRIKCSDVKSDLDYVASNIPVVLAIIIYMYVEDRKFVLYNKKETEARAKWEAMKEAGEDENQGDEEDTGGDEKSVDKSRSDSSSESDDEMEEEEVESSIEVDDDEGSQGSSDLSFDSEEGEPEDQVKEPSKKRPKKSTSRKKEESKEEESTEESPVKKCRNDRLDKGQWFSVRSGLRTHLLTYPKIEGRMQRSDPAFPRVGTAWRMSNDDKVYKWGKHISSRDWSNNEPIFILDGLNYDEGCTLDRFVHMICSGGFQDSVEERVWFKKHADVDMAKAEKKDLLTRGQVGRQIYYVRNFWCKCEVDLKLIKIIKKKKGKEPFMDYDGVMVRLQKLLAGALKKNDFIKIFDGLDEEDDESNSNKFGGLKVDGLFKDLHFRLAKKGQPGMEQLAHQLELQKQRVLLHKAALSLTSVADSKIQYDFAKHFNNSAADPPKNGTWNAEGRLVTTLARNNVARDFECYKELLLTTAKSREAELGVNHKQDNIEGKSNYRTTTFR